MRVVLSTYGSRGDVEPMAALAVRLRERGVRVAICAPPDFADLLARVEVPLVPSGPAVRGIVSGPDRWRPEDMAQRATELLTDRYEALVGAAADGCDLIVATGLFPAAAGARAAAEKLGAGYVYVSFFATMLPSPHHPPHVWPGRTVPPGLTGNRDLWDLDARNMNEMFGGVVGAHRTSVGLPPVENVRDHVFTRRPWLAADPVLGPWRASPDLEVVQTGAWLLPDERPLPAELARFLDSGTPPVFVGFGSMPMLAATDTARVAVEAIRGLGRRVILSRGWAGLESVDDRDDCFVVGEVNQQALFERVAAVVHHGGAGTTTAAARAGAPQVIVPQVVDQPYWAGRATELGIGVAHEGSEPTVESLSAAVEDALASAAGARTVAGSIRADGAAVAADLLVDAIRRKDLVNA